MTALCGVVHQREAQGMGTVVLGCVANDEPTPMSMEQQEQLGSRVR